MRPALPSALPYVNDLDVGEHISKRRHPNCRIFAFPSSTGDIPFLVFSPRIKKPRLKGDFSPVHAPALPNRGRTLHLVRNSSERGWWWSAYSVRALVHRPRGKLSRQS